MFHLPNLKNNYAKTCGGVYCGGLRPLTYWDCGYESSRERMLVSSEPFCFCQVEVSASSRSLVQRGSTDSGGSNWMRF